MLRVNDIRNLFANEFAEKRFTVDRNGGKTIEILSASFIADESAIFGTPNQEYIDAEIKWYESRSLNIHDIYGVHREPPKAWIATADSDGYINSNYGYLIWSEKNFSQYENALTELLLNPDSRRASMIYTRPSIWYEYNENGKSDFICTNAVTYYIRDNKLHCVVQMRSNDAWAGFRNDYAWQRYVLNEMAFEYNLHRVKEPISVGNIHWQCQNLHLYERNFYLVDYYLRTGEWSVNKSDYVGDYV